MSKYIPTIGIETHVQLKTKTKLFSGVDNDASQAAPNTLISHIDTGMPGALPVLNKYAVELAAKTAFILNTEPQKYSYFERKHYFYPDSPAGYQISQLHAPAVVGGFVEISIDGQKKKIGINRAQLEADAGKNTHPAGADYSLVDLNRAGTPLLEIVSEPDIHSAAEAKAYVRELYLAMRYGEISDCDLYLGHMRFDVNVSLSDSPDRLGIRAEIKNLNSFRSVEAAVNYEIKRQTELLEKGEAVVQETRGWDEAKQKTTSQRSKEEAQDYRYMPEPDVPPVVLNDDYIEDIKKSLTPAVNEIRAKLADYDFPANTIEDVLDNPEINNKLSAAIKSGAVSEVIKRIAYDSLEKPETLSLSIEKHIKVAAAQVGGVLSSSAASSILSSLISQADADVDKLISGNLQVSDEGEIEKIVAEVLAENEKAAQDVREGEMKAIGYLIGQVMAKSKGKANPGLAQQLIKKQLGV